MKTKKTRLAVCLLLDEELYNLLKEERKKTGVPMCKTIRRVLRDFFDKEEACKH